jgi:putative FmdB family regulatory protein
MPIYEYQAAAITSSCDYCRNPFEVIQRISDPRLTACPRCNAPLIKIISAHTVGGSRSNLDDRAKSAGFHKLKKLGKGEYEKQY